ncbi:hypothetical protein B0T21DRAFT_438074, partial [Apiosordaria backusii]
TLHPSPLLPSELRVHIWRLTIQPRTVEINTQHPPRTEEVITLKTLTPVPPVLQACHESRSELIRSGYTTGYSELTPLGQFQGDVPPPSEQRRYVWINWEIDTLNIGQGGHDQVFTLKDYAPIAPLVRKLTFARENTDEAYYHFEAHELHVFENTKRIYVVCQDGFGAWYDAAEVRFWPCGVENVVVIDEGWAPWCPTRLRAGNGRRVEVGLLEMKLMVDTRRDEARRRHREELFEAMVAEMMWPWEQMRAMSGLLEWLELDEANGEEEAVEDGDGNTSCE